MEEIGKKRIGDERKRQPIDVSIDFTPPLHSLTCLLSLLDLSQNPGHDT